MTNRFGDAWLAEDENQLVSMVDAGQSWEAIAGVLGRTVSGVYAHYSKLKTCYVTLPDIVRLIGVPHSTLSTWFHAGCFGRIMRAVDPEKTMARRRVHYRITMDQLLQFVGDPFYAGFIVPERVCPTIRDCIVDIETWYVSRSWHGFVEAGWHESVSYRWIKDGVMPAVRDPRNYWLIPRSVADQTIAGFLRGASSAEVKQMNAELAFLLNGFDADVATAWREPWKWESS